MNYSALNTTVGQLSASSGERPERAVFFESLGIDCCCSDRKPPGEACALTSPNSGSVLSGLEEAGSTSLNTTDIEWSTAALSDLINHITDRHHAYLRDALPRLTYLLNKVWDAHAQHHPELSEIVDQFAQLRSDLEQHMMDEEQRLFPLCRKIEGDKGQCDNLSRTVRSLVSGMEEEHSDTFERFQRLRALTDNYCPPQDACPTYRVMLNSLAEMEADTRLHIRKENELLFRRVLEVALQKATGS